MKTAIVNGHWAFIPARELTDADAHRITVALAAQGIRVEPVVDADHVLQLWAKQPTTTAQEVTALRAYAACTDCRIAWHAAGAR